MGAGRTRAIRISGGNRADGYANEALGASSRGENADLYNEQHTANKNRWNSLWQKKKTNEDNDLDVFELLPSDRTISSAFSALLAAEFFLKIFFYKIFNLEWSADASGRIDSRSCAT